MNKTDNMRPVSSIKYDDKRAAIPGSAHQGEEQMAISELGEKGSMRFGIIEEYRNDRKSCWQYSTVAAPTPATSHCTVRRGRRGTTA